MHKRPLGAAHDREMYDRSWPRRGKAPTSQRQPARSVTSGHVSEILVSAFCVRAANSWQAELLAAAAGSGRAVGGRGC